MLGGADSASGSDNDSDDIFRDINGGVRDTVPRNRYFSFSSFLELFLVTQCEKSGEKKGSL